MAIRRTKISLTTDTGSNDADFTPSVMGQFVQYAYVPGDTGVRADTGAVLTITADTGTVNTVLVTKHLVPNTSNWVADAGGYVLSGENLKVSVQGVTGRDDTGKAIELYLYFSDVISSGSSSQFGEVQGVPTPNTILARLKDIDDSIQALTTGSLSPGGAGVLVALVDEDGNYVASDGDNAIRVKEVASDTGGVSVITDTGPTNGPATSVKTTPGTVYWASGRNNTNHDRYLHLYNDRDTGWDTGDPAHLTLVIPGTDDTGEDRSAGFYESYGNMGVKFDDSISYVVKKVRNGSDTGALGTDVVVNIGYA